MLGKKLILAVIAGLLGLGFGVNQAPAVTWYEANSGNTAVAIVGLSANYLGNDVLNNPGALISGSNNFNYAALVFMPTVDGVYTLGQTYATTDTVMILYSDLFDAANPGQGALVGNDDTSQANHRTATEDQSLVVSVGSSSNYGPQVEYTLVAGQIYTIVVSTYRTNSSLDVPFMFYSTGTVIFGTYNGNPDFTGPANTYNQRNVGLALENLGNNVLRNSIVLMGATPQLLDSLTGEIYATVPTVLLNQDVKLRGRMLNQAQQGGSGSNIIRGYDSPQFVTNNEWNSGVNFWVEGGGDLSLYDGTKNTGKAKFYGPEILMGADVFFSNNWQAGMAVRYSDKKLEVNSRNSSSDVQSYSAGAYVSKSLSINDLSALRFTLGGLIGYHDIDTRRKEMVFYERLESGYSARSWQVFTEAAYTTPLMDNLWLEPFVNVSYNAVGYGSFAETGGTASLRLKSKTYDNIDTQLGSRATFLVNNWAALYGELAWQHTYGDVRHKTAVSFKDYGGNFKIKGGMLNRDAALINLGVKLGIQKGVYMDLGYNGNWGDRSQSHGGSVQLSFAF